MAPELAAEARRARAGPAARPAVRRVGPGCRSPRPSIGQVHRAITRDGRAVAVKVQYPGVDEAITADLDNAGLLFRRHGHGVPRARARAARRRAAGPHRRGARLRPRGPQPAAVRRLLPRPPVHPRARGGATSCRPAGCSPPSWPRASGSTRWPRGARTSATWPPRRSTGSCSAGCTGSRPSTATPTPATTCSGRAGRSRSSTSGWSSTSPATSSIVFGDMIRAMVDEPDMQRFRRIVEGAGLLKPGGDFTDDAGAGVLRPLLRVRARRRRGDDHARVVVRDGGPVLRRQRPLRRPIMKAANLPPSFVIIQRINLGLMAILGDLRATANFRRIANELWPWVDGPASTDLGEAEAAWLAERAGRRARLTPAGWPVGAGRGPLGCHTPSLPSGRAGGTDRPWLAGQCAGVAPSCAGRRRARRGARRARARGGRGRGDRGLDGRRPAAAVEGQRHLADPLPTAGAGGRRPRREPGRRPRPRAGRRRGGQAGGAGRPPADHGRCRRGLPHGAG